MGLVCLLVCVDVCFVLDWLFGWLLYGMFVVVLVCVWYAGFGYLVIWLVNVCRLLRCWCCLFASVLMCAGCR